MTLPGLTQVSRPVKQNWMCVCKNDDRDGVDGGSDYYDNKKVEIKVESTLSTRSALQSQKWQLIGVS